MKLSIEQSLRQIADMLVLNGTLVDCPGLLHGKTGIAIFFFHYARYTANVLYEDYALDLIEEAQIQIHNNSPADYERGIAGIGVGINYLIRNNFLNADEDIFEDLDQRMYRAVMYDPWSNFSLYDGLSGYGRYWIMRLYQQTSTRQAKECLLKIAGQIKEKVSNIPAKEQTDVYCFLHDLQQISIFNICPVLLEQYQKWDLQSADFSRLRNTTIGNIIRIYQHNYYNRTQPDEFDVALKQIPDLDMEKPPAAIGFLTGYVGEGLLRLTTLDPMNVSWMQLL